MDNVDVTIVYKHAAYRFSIVARSIAISGQQSLDPRWVKSIKMWYKLGRQRKLYDLVLNRDVGTCNSREAYNDSSLSKENLVTLCFPITRRL